MRPAKIVAIGLEKAVCGGVGVWSSLLGGVDLRADEREHWM